MIPEMNVHRMSVDELRCAREQAMELIRTLGPDRQPLRLLLGDVVELVMLETAVHVCHGDREAGERLHRRLIGQLQD